MTDDEIVMLMGGRHRIWRRTKVGRSGSARGASKRRREWSWEECVMKEVDVLGVSAHFLPSETVLARGPHPITAHVPADTLATCLGYFRNSERGDSLTCFL